MKTESSELEQYRRDFTEKYIAEHCGNYTDKEKTILRNSIHVGWELHLHCPSAWYEDALKPITSPPVANDEDNVFPLPELMLGVTSGTSAPSPDKITVDSLKPWTEELVREFENKTGVVIEKTPIELLDNKYIKWLEQKLLAMRGAEHLRNKDGK